MNDKQEWRLWAEWLETQSSIFVSLNCDQCDPLITGTIHDGDDEIIRVVLGDRPPSISDAVAARIVLAIYQYFDADGSRVDPTITERVDMLTWLDQELGSGNAAAIWTALSFHQAKNTAPPPAVEDTKESPREWHFSSRWLEEPQEHWRLAQVQIKWRQDQESGVLAVVAKISSRGGAAIQHVTNDDLLLGPCEMGWLIRQLVSRFWKQMLAYETIVAEVENFRGWLGVTRGQMGAHVLSMIEVTLRTFGASRPDSQ